MLILNVALIIKVLIGALIVVLIQVISGTKNYYIAALVPLFPSFSIISYYVLGTERGVKDLRMAIKFGIFSLIPYLIFLISLYILTRYFKIEYSLMLSCALWLIVAIILIFTWNLVVR